MRALPASESNFLPGFEGRFSAKLVYLSRGLQNDGVASNEGRRDLGNSKVDRVAAGKVRKLSIDQLRFTIRWTIQKLRNTF